MEILDQLGQILKIKQKPKRIVSLVPSMTELAYGLVKSKYVVGRTKFCIHPEQMVNQATIIGGTKNPRIQDILNLKPDLILANKEENIQSHIDQLRETVPVYVSDVKTASDNEQMILDLGRILQAELKSLSIVADTEMFLNEIKPFIKKKIKVLYLIWKDPYMTIGGDTYIHTMLNQFGFINSSSIQMRYPEINIEEIKAQNPDMILLSSEPYPFQEQHLKEFQSQIPGIEVKLVDGEVFSWYGNRILKKKEYVLSLLKSLRLQK